MKRRALHGQAKGSIVLDGKVIWASEEMKPGDISPELSLPIAGGKRLEVHADPTTRLDVLGRFDWPTSRCGANNALPPVKDSPGTIPESPPNGAPIQPDQTPACR